eukprot:g25501.t1
MSFLFTDAHVVEEGFLECLVAEHFLANVTGIDDVRSHITETMSYAHLSVTLQYSPQFEVKYKRRNFATPKNYLDFLSNYMKFLENNRNSLDQMSGRLGGGLDKLVQAAVQELEEKKAIVDENAIKVRELIDIINEKTEAVTKRKEEASAAAEQIEKDSAIIEKEKADADEALQAALPALESAAKALEELDKKDITEVKGMASPPPPDADTMTRRLNAASQLIEGLASERKRWTEDLQKMGEVKKRLVGDCLLNAAFVSYAGPFNHEFRKEMVYVDWQERLKTKGIDKTEEFKIETLLTSDVEVASWSGHGLPTDELCDPVLEKKVVIVNGQKMITLGDNQLEWNESFMLYMTTKLSNPKYTPEVMGKASIVNCVITLDGLAAQLLNVVVGFERPDLEERRRGLEIKNLEDILLHDLAASKGSILDNDDLIHTLNTAKATSIQIGVSLETAAKTAEEIEKTRALYVSVAKRGSILYFAMSGMVAISEMYEYSLSSYLGVFDTALRDAKPDKIEKVDLFKQVLIIRSIRPDRMITATKGFIAYKLSDYYVQPPSLSSEWMPIVFILSPGADPQSDVAKLGDQLGFTGPKFRFVSLGQGMGGVAQQTIETGYQRGNWVMLQNCHLLASWLRTLEKILEQMHKPHKDFRLWLTTMPFPPQLQSGVAIPV